MTRNEWLTLSHNLHHGLKPRGWAPTQSKGSRIQAHHVQNEYRGRSALLLFRSGCQLSSLQSGEICSRLSSGARITRLEGHSGNTEHTTLEWGGCMGSGQPVRVSPANQSFPLRYKCTRKSPLPGVPTMPSCCVTWSQTFSEPSLPKGRGSRLENSRF